MKPNLEESRRHGVEELQTLRGMVLAWREGYLQTAPPGGGEEYLFLCEDFHLEIEEYVYPYLRRMVITEHIDEVQAGELLEFCSRQVSELREYLLGSE